MEQAIGDYTDILIPRREDFSTVIYFLRGFHVQTAFKQSDKRKTEALVSEKVQFLVSKVSFVHVEQECEVYALWF